MKKIEGKIISIVPARAGSKGFPGKNFRCFAGQPLFMHAINQALRVSDFCIFTTDNQKVLESLKPIEGLFLHKRQPKYATDDSPMHETLTDVCNAFKMKRNTIVLLQPTAPIRSDRSIQKAIKLHNEGSYELVMGISEANSDVLKTGLVSGGNFIPINEPSFCFANRQALPKVYKPNGSVFVFNSDWFKSRGELTSKNIGYVLQPNNIDIDSATDFWAAEEIFTANQSNQI